MTNQTQLTSQEIQLLQKLGIDNSENLKQEIENLISNKNEQTSIQEIIYRQATLSDISGILAVQKKTMIDAFVGEKYGITLEMVEKDFLNYTEKLTKYFKTTAYFVAEINQKIVGVVAAPSDRKIRTMWVDPDFQRLGIGQKLMLMAIAEFGDIAEIKLETGLQKNGQAVKFYESLGFEKTGKESKIKFFPEQTGEVECIELVLKPEKIAEILKNQEWNVFLLNDSHSDFIDQYLPSFALSYLPKDTDLKVIENIKNQNRNSIIENNKSDNPKFITLGISQNDQILLTAELKFKSDKINTPFNILTLNPSSDFDLEKDENSVVKKISSWIFKNFNLKNLHYDGRFKNLKEAETRFDNFNNSFVFEKMAFDSKYGQIAHITVKISNPNYQPPIQDKNWIINNLGWIDVKEIFRNSGFKAFADLCEPIIKQDWDVETLTIETERLILKPVSMEYAEEIFREFTPEVAKTLLSQPLKNLEEQKEFIIERMKRMENRKQIMFVILGKSGEFLGVCNFHGIHTKILTAGIWLKINSHGQGFGSEAMTGMTNWAKTHLNFESIKYESYQENFASGKIAQKLGGQFIQSKKITRLDGKIVNGVEYQIKNPNYQPSNSRVQSLVIKNATDKFSRSDLDKIQDLGRSFGLPGIAYIQFESPSLEGGSGADGRGFTLVENTQTPPALRAAPSSSSQALQVKPNGALQAKSPILKFFGDENAQKTKQQEIQDFLGIQAGDLVLFLAHADKDLIHKAQNAIRKHVAAKLDLLDQNSLKFVWIYDFPFFEEVEQKNSPTASRSSKVGTLEVDFAHNPFGIFQNWYGLTHIETLKLAKEQNRLLELRAVQYDIACNGYEVLSGGRRNNIPECLMEGFKLVGYTEEEVKEKFGHMMEAYSYGAPTHAGFAWGIDRLFMVLMEENNIRETIAFPKNGSGMDLMMNSPSTVRESQLKELSIKSV